jgi:glycosyltransferase involved in cell wall biosynthesis
MTVRVLFVSKEYQPLYSGVARHIQGLAQALVDDPAVALSMLAPQVGEGHAPLAVMRGGYRRLWSCLRSCDVVHLHGSRTPLVFCAALLARLRRLPVVYTPHCYYDDGSLPERALKRLWDLAVERALLRIADTLVLLHEGWVDDLARRGLNPRRVMVIPNCIDAQRTRRSSYAVRLEGRPAVLSIGRLDPIKRLDDMLQALADPHLADAMLHVVGRGDERERLEALAEQLGISGRVYFHGWQDDDASAAMMAGCDTMILASAREGMPTVVLEALLAGVPIACSDIEGNRAILDAVGWDALFAMGDVSALARCVQATAQRQVSEQVREAVRRRFTWEGQAPRLAERYLELANPPQASGWHRRLARKLVDYDNPESLGSRIRKRRLMRLMSMIDRIHAQYGHVKIIDVGGTQQYWRLLPAGYLEARSVSITLVNVRPVAMPFADSCFTFMQADGCDLQGVDTGAFHLAHSNSVIEHVGDPVRMARFASELQRVAECYYVQTPDFWCPLEPHFMAPIFHWLPRALRIQLVRHLALGHWRRARNRAEAEAIVNSARLLSRRELQALLPGATILHERVLGVPKSLIAVGP